MNNYYNVGSLITDIPDAYSVNSFRELKCNRSLWAWLHLEATGDVERESRKRACRLKDVKLRASWVTD